MWSNKNKDLQNPHEAVAMVAMAIPMFGKVPMLVNSKKADNSHNALPFPTLFGLALAIKINKLCARLFIPGFSFKNSLCAQNAIAEVF